jgi:hypothetical protein
MQEPIRDPVPFGRYAVAGLIGALLVSGILLLARPLLFSLSPLLDDTNYAVGGAGQVTEPLLRELLLNQSHGLQGEVRDGDRTQISVVVAPFTADSFSVVNAWSPTHDCALELGADRLRDCAGDAWTFDGVPLDPADPPLEAFPASVANGAIVVDFTRLIDPRSQ